MGMGRLLADGEKTRIFTLVAYPENFDGGLDEIYDICDDLGVRCCVSPLHDEDVYDRRSVRKWERNHPNPTSDELERKPVIGERKKSHVHIPFILGNPATRAYILRNYAEPLKVRQVWKDNDKIVAKRYMCHLDHPKKAQYAIRDCRPFGGYDLSDIDQPTEEDKLGCVARICGAVREHGFDNFFDCTEWVLSEGDPELFKALLGRSGFVNYYIDGYVKVQARKMPQMHYSRPITSFDNEKVGQR